MSHYNRKRIYLRPAPPIGHYKRDARFVPPQFDVIAVLVDKVDFQFSENLYFNHGWLLQNRQTKIYVNWDGRVIRSIDQRKVTAALEVFNETQS